MDVGTSVQKGFDTIAEFLPRVIAFLVILVIGYFVAKILGAVVRKALDKVGLDRRLRESEAGRHVDRIGPDANASRLVGRVVFWLVFAFFLISAIAVLNVPALTDFMGEVLAYLPNVIAAIVIFVIAAMVAGLAGRAASRLMGDTPTSRIVGTVVPALIMVLAAFMILEQLRIAPDIVRIAFAATMGALALGLALAFGLGGRPVAERMLEDAYRRGQLERDQVRRSRQMAEPGRGGYPASEPSTAAPDASPSTSPDIDLETTSRMRTTGNPPR